MKHMTTKPRLSKVALIVIRVYSVPDEVNFLMMRHGKRGDMSFIGGHVEPGETYLDAAYRELEEEAPTLSPHFELLPLTERRRFLDQDGVGPVLYDMQWFIAQYISSDNAAAYAVLATTRNPDFKILDVGGMSALPLARRLDEYLPHSLYCVPRSVRVELKCPGLEISR